MTNTSKNKNTLTALQQAIIDCGVEKLTFTSHKIEKTVNISDCADSSLLMLLDYGRQRKMNDSVNDKSKKLAEKEKISIEETYPIIIDEFIDKMINGVEFYQKQSDFDKELLNQVKNWLIGKGYANTKSFSGLAGLSPRELLDTFCKTPADLKTENERRIKQLSERAQAVIDLRKPNID